MRASVKTSLAKLQQEGQRNERDSNPAYHFRSDLIQRRAEKAHHDHRDRQKEQANKLAFVGPEFNRLQSRPTQSPKHVPRSLAVKTVSQSRGTNFVRRVHSSSGT